jgi:glycosyltransferase involved in cell wall biosynthesis
MALKVPIVATRINGVPRLIQDGVTGLLVEPGDGDGLTTAIAAMLKNVALRDVFARSARRVVETKYSFSTRMDRLKRMYDELLSC